MQDWIVPGVAVLLALLALALGVALLRARSRTERELAEARAETEAVRARLDALERRVARPEPRPTDTEYVITGLGEARPNAATSETGTETGDVPTVGSALFADLVLRETVVKAASLAHGVRRALDPETRNRIRFEMRREAKRARKQRRADARQARRDWAARERGTAQPAAGDAA